MIQKLPRKPKTVVPPVRVVPTFSETGIEGIPAVIIPAGARSYLGFVAWRTEQDHPKRPKIAFLNGEVWIDMNAEIMETHNILKAQISRIIAEIVDSENSGFVFVDGMLVSVPKANVANEPDAFFVSVESLRTGRVIRQSAKRALGTSVINGPPDWILEVVSDSSVEKDTVILKEAYFRAGVREYWLVDARQEKVDFQIFVPGKNAFVSQARRGGWVASPLFNRKFSLQRKTFAQDFWRWELQQTPLAKKNG